MLQTTTDKTETDMRSYNQTGRQNSHYCGPEIVATFVVMGERITRKARLNNPRRTVDSVRVALCASVREQYPTAKLVSCTH